VNEITFIDLFSGIGGVRKGLDNCSRSLSFGEGSESKRDMFNGIRAENEHGPPRSFRCVWSNDFNKYANQVYTARFGEANHHPGDIRGIDATEIPDHDLLCGGFPCQSFSVAGRRKGFEDTRGTLFFEICRIVEAKRPSLLLLENVKGLLNHDKGRTFTVILQTLDELGYWVEWQVLNSKHFGVPQNRERVFIIGHLRGTGRREIFPIGEGDELSETGRGEGKTENQLATAITQNLKRGVHSGGETLIKIGNVAESGHDSLWGRVYDPDGLASNLNAEGGGVGAKTGLYVVPVLTPDRPEKRQHGRRFKEDGEPSFTLTGQDIHGVMIANRRIRRLTPCECERLQGFPDRFTETGLQDGKLVKVSDTQRYKMLGNAITVPVVTFLGERILDSLGKLF